MGGGASGTVDGGKEGRVIAITRWIPAILLGAGCLLTLGVDRQRDMPLAEALDSIPMTLGGRAGRDLEIAENERVARAPNDGLQAALAGAKTPAQAMKDAQAEADRILKSHRR